MARPRRITRRTVLRGLGAAVSLPWLEAMSFGADGVSKGAAAAGILSGKGTAPLRMAFLYVPNGMHMQALTPTAVGKAFELTPLLSPLAKYKDDLLVLTGLAQDHAFAHKDGAGDHARSLAVFLTGVHVLKSDKEIHCGVSVDQLAASKIGDRTRFPSLEIGIDRGAQSGNCDSGYSCAYSSNIAWKSPTTPVAKEVNPRLVFERLFGDADSSSGSADERVRRRYLRKSVLDFVAEDARNLAPILGLNDRRKLDEYMTSVREIERRIARAEHKIGDPAAPKHQPPGIPKDNQEHIRLMMDMLVLAFQTDQTRIATFMLANEGSNKSYEFIGVPEGHHDLSHHGGDPKKHEKIKKINDYHIKQYAYLLERLKSIREGDGTLLDHSMIVYGSGISDGNKHNHDNLPIIMAGRGNGTIHTGRHVKLEKTTPLNNLYVEMLDRVGVKVDRFGDSDGRLPQLTV